MIRYFPYLLFLTLMIVCGLIGYGLGPDLGKIFFWVFAYCAALAALEG